MMLSVRIILVNYRTATCLIDCLHALQPEIESEPDARVIIVDNASPDDSIDRLTRTINQNGWNSCVELLPLSSNRGFGAGNNAAIRRLLPDQPDLIYLLNPDTIPRPGAIRFLREFLQSHPRVGMAGGRLENPDGTPQTSAFRFPNLFSQIDEGFRLRRLQPILGRFQTPLPPMNEPRSVDWLTGASLMIRRSVFEQIGLFDEQFFLYFEEVDFCKRAAMARIPRWHVPASRVVHLEGQSTGLSSQRISLKRRPKYWFDSRKRYFRKHHGRFGSLFADFGFFLPHLTYRLRRRLQRKPDPDPPQFTWDFLRYSF